MDYEKQVKVLINLIPGLMDLSHLQLANREYHANVLYEIKEAIELTEEESNRLHSQRGS